MRSRTPWSVEELSQLEDLAKRKYSLQIIALKLGRSAAAVQSKARELKISMRTMKRSYMRRSDGNGFNGAAVWLLFASCEVAIDLCAYIG